MNDEIYIIIQKIGDFETVVDKAYWYWKEANVRMNEISSKAFSDGYTDFTWYIKPLWLIGLKE